MKIGQGNEYAARTAEMLSVADSFMVFAKKCELNASETIFALLAAAHKVALDNDALPGFVRGELAKVEKLMTTPPAPDA